MANFLKDNDDLAYYLDRGGIDWDALIAVTEPSFSEASGFSDAEEARQFYRASLEMVGELTAEKIAPYALELDRAGVTLENGEVVFPPRMNAIFEHIRGLELHGMCVPRELGGQNAPMLLYFVNTELFARADVSVMAHHGFHGGIAMAMLMFSAKEGTTKLDAASGQITSTRFAREIDEVRRGDAWGCMDITEPDAGSDMAALKCRGELGHDGIWRVTGQKIFITSGHGKYHFVIARTEAPTDGSDPLAGLGGLSLFLVPTYEDGPDGRKRFVSVDRIEEKMGHHGSATCALTFENAPAELVGQRGEGFKYMLMLMNNARLGVGFECIGLCEAAYRLAKAYAAERRSMGKSLDQHEMIADYLDEMGTDIQGLRTLAMHGAFHEELAQKQSLRLAHADLDPFQKKQLEREIERHKTEARRVTPLLKYLGAEKAVEIARRGLQIHGGVGYVEEYGAAKLLRDATVMPIYEGTSQIQALMAMKDSLSRVLASPQAFVKRIAQTRWRRLATRDPLEKRVLGLTQLLNSALQVLIRRTAGAKVRGLGALPLSEWPSKIRQSWDPKRDFAPALLHAERLTRILCDATIAELLLDQARRHPERIAVLERHLERAEPRCRYLLTEINTTGARLLSQLAEKSPEEAAAS
jgi:alkylation response protein AidB-like acyl-CoA dehydrogenase